MKTITATSRLASALKRQHDLQRIAEDGRAWESADIRTLSDWVLEEWKDWLYAGHEAAPRIPLSQLEECVLWESIIRNDGGHDLLDVSAAAKSAASAWKLVCDWRIPASHLPRRSAGTGYAFAEWAREFSARCTKRNRFSRSELVTAVADLVEKGLAPVPDALERAGFVEVTPAQERLFTALRRRGTHIVERPIPDCNRTAVRLGLADANSEIHAAAEWARMKLETDPRASSPTYTIGVLVPELKRLRWRIEHIFGEVFHPSTRMQPDESQRRLFKLSPGLPTSEYPIVRAALDILQADPESMPIETASRILRSPFLKEAESELTRRALLDAELRSRGDAHVTLRQILKLAKDENAAHGCTKLRRMIIGWMGWNKKSKKSRLSSQWRKELIDLLTLVGWPREFGIYSSENDAVSSWTECLNELAELDGVAGHVTKDRAVSLLKRIADDRESQPKADLVPVQIFDQTAIEGLSFDGLWIMGMHDNAWPPLAGPDPLLPAAMQRQRRMPHSSADQELARASALTDRMKSCATDLVVSYPKRESDLDLRISPLFADLEQATADMLGLQLSGTYLEELLKGPIEVIEDHYGPPCSNSVQSGGTYLFKAQAACPFKAFAEVRLGASASDWPDPGLSVMDRGRLTHQILQEVWTELQTHKDLCATPAEDLQKLVASTVASRTSAYLGSANTRKNTQTNEVERNRLETLVLNWLEHEKDRAPFALLEQEKKRRVELGGIETDVRIDRVDRLADGQLVVIDYKTGACNTSDWEGERPNEPQLPIYATTSEEAVAGVFFGSLRTDKVRFVGLADMDIAPGQRNGLAEAATEWPSALDQLGADFKAGHARVDPKKRGRTCRHCNLPGLCRIDLRDKRDG